MSSLKHRRAAIDVGSNTTRLIVADIDSGCLIKEVAREMKITGLARGFNGKDLAHESLARTKSVLVEFYDLASRLGAELIVIGFTGVARRAENIKPLLDELNTLERAEALVLPDHLEAKLSAKGVHIKTGREEFLLVDVGGGSTEISLKAIDQFSFFSFPVGTVDLEERYSVRGAVSTQTLDEMKREISKKIEPAKVWANSKLPLFANAATATICAAVVQKLDRWDSFKIENFEVKLSELERILDELAEIPEGERARRYPILLGRESVFICGLVILWCTLRVLCKSSFFVTEGSLLEGLLFLDSS